MIPRDHRLARVVDEAFLDNPGLEGRATQVGTDPPTFVLFVRGGELGPDYLRFLENRLRSAYDFTGTPIRLIARRRTGRDGRG